MHANMHLKLPKHLQQKSKLLKIREYFFQKDKQKCICQKVFSRPVKWLKKNFVGEKENNEEKFSKIEI